MNDYELRTPGDYCKTPTPVYNKEGEFVRDTWNLAATSGDFYTDDITLCIYNLNNHQQDQVSTLGALSALEKEGVSLADRRTHSLTLFHGIFHMMRGQDATLDEAYGLNECIHLKAKQKQHNPESYVFFALAQYHEENPDYTFANTKALSKRKTKA
ncbi:Fc.00g010660.m01.CDS01 [Cosmosporella sp. VM-42]